MGIIAKTAIAASGLVLFLQIIIHFQLIRHDRVSNMEYPVKRFVFVFFFQSIKALYEAKIKYSKLYFIFGTDLLILKS